MHAAAHSPKQLSQRTCVRIVLIGLVVLLQGAGYAAMAPQDPVPAGVDPNVVADVNAVAAPRLPLVAEITGNDVFLRSGPGTNYYMCGKLYKGDRVQVLRTQNSWSCILPPPGCFSWISMQYLSINLDNPTLAIVTGDGVGVYAGSDYVEPMHSTSKQAVLPRGAKVKLLGEEKDDYYKIAPPENAYLWVHSKFVQPIEGELPGPDPAVAINPDGTQGPPQPPADQTNLTVEQDKLKEFYELKKQIDAEREKPMDQQDYSKLLESMQAIAENKEAGRAARYADYMSKRLARFQLALSVMKEIQIQNAELEKTRTRIDEARAARLAQVEGLGKYSVIGEFKPFMTYGPGHYRIVDSSGKTICYAVPAKGVSAVELPKLVGKKVGLVGKIEADATFGGAAVKFTEIAPVN